MHQRVCKGWIDPRHRTRVLIFSRTNKRCNTFGTHVPWTEIHSSCRRFSPRFTSSLSLITLFLSLARNSANRIEGRSSGTKEDRRMGNEKGKRGNIRSPITRDSDGALLSSSLSLSLSLRLETMVEKSQKKRSWWLDCRHGSVFEAAHRAHFINGAGRVVDAFACRLNVARDWPRYYKRGAWLARDLAVPWLHPRGSLRSRRTMFPRLSLSLCASLRCLLPFDSPSLFSPRSSIGVIREQWHFTVFLHLSDYFHDYSGDWTIDENDFRPNWPPARRNGRLASYFPLLTLIEFLIFLLFWKRTFPSIPCKTCQRSPKILSCFLSSRS